MAFGMKELINFCRVTPGKKINMRKDYDPGFTAPGGSKEEATQKQSEGIEILAGCRTSCRQITPKAYHHTTSNGR